MKRDEFIKWVKDKTSFIKEGKKNIYWRYEEGYTDFIDVADNVVIYGWMEEEDSKKYLFKFHEFIKYYDLQSYHKNRILKIEL